MSDSLDPLCVNAVRVLAIEAVQQANSGHPGLPLGAAPMATVLWRRHLRIDPTQPDWPDRDRFLLSAGHGSMLLYALLHLSGHDLSLDDIRNFRQWGSKTPGHPEFGHTPGVEATTGPLGQGTANAVGMAMAERALAHRFNRPGHEIVDHHTFALVSDGDLMEGLSYEAASLAGHLKLGKLVYLYDANDISLDGPLSLAFSENVVQRFQSCGWHTLEVADGDRDLEGIDRAIAEAKAETGRPSLIVVKTTLGFGSPSKAGTAAAHGSPLGDEEVAATKRALDWPETEPFRIPDAVRVAFDLKDKGREARAQWEERFEAYSRAHPDLRAQWDAAWSCGVPEDLENSLPSFPTDKPIATRSASGKVLNAVAAQVPSLIGGDADLSCSTKTAIDGAGSFDGATGSGRNVHFGVREHAMAAAANGMELHGGVRAYTATFFCFADYMRPSIRLAALSGLPVVFVFTHDSIGVGEDGPTHQPVEHLMSLRAMPGVHVVRPGDANETKAAWTHALRRTSGPTVLVFSRQNLPVLEAAQRPASETVSRGAYVLADADGSPDAVLIATGSEVSLALAARDLLQADGRSVRVVSMPCMEAFADLPADERDRVLPPEVRTRVAIEAGSTLGWERWVGDGGAIVGIDRFGASAPASMIQQELGLTPERVADEVRRLWARETGGVGC